MQSKLDSLQVWYFEIQEKSHSRSELLQQALCNAKIFGEDEVELMNWLNEAHGKLSKLSVQDHSTEGCVLGLGVCVSSFTSQHFKVLVPPSSQ